MRVRRVLLLRRWHAQNLKAQRAARQLTFR